MEEGQRNVLRRLRPELVNDIQNHGRLFDVLESKRALPKSIIDKIRSLSDEKEQIRQMLDRLQKRPVFDAFYDCLIESDNASIADLLKPELAEDRKSWESLNKRKTSYSAIVPGGSGNGGIGDGLAERVVNRSEVRRGSGSVQTYQPSEDVENRSLSGDGPDPEWSPDKVVVFPTDSQYITELYRTRSSKCYNMHTHPRGRAIVAYNNKFPADILRGTFQRENDLKAVERLLEGLEFNVTWWQDCSKQDFLNKLEAESKNPDNDNHDSFMMIMLTHGTDAGLLMADGGIVTELEILEYFSTSKCRYLLQKPKLFFIQACRGKQKDEGRMDAQPTQMGLGELLSRAPVAEMGSKDDADAIPTTAGNFADMLVSNATFTGYKSYAYSQRKSTWYVQTLTEVFSKKSCEEDVVSMLTMVHDLISKVRTKGDAVQTPNISMNTLTKKVYFFPGL
ncbi:caspase-7-like [Tubulanus polymorphus]|uniref:caspase-7-like n=1 Tax=Tubulanus polymorphus TaxID=672921 RepID=UPI003DA2E8CB